MDKVTIINIADIHARLTDPEHRKDYLSALKAKMNFISKYINKCAAINNVILTIPGDLFDIPTVPDAIKTYMINWLKSLDVINILGVIGNHDMRHRSMNIEDTSLGVLQSSGWIDILGMDINEDKNLNYRPTFSHKFVDFYGVNCDQPIPKEINSTNQTNVLLIHKMISDKDYWNGHVSFSSAESILSSFNYDIVLSGDNHMTFTKSLGRKTLINCGSLMRIKTNQWFHQPHLSHVTIAQDGSYDIQMVPIPILPPEQIFIESNKTDTVTKQELTEFATYMKTMRNNINKGIPFEEYIKRCLDIVDDDDIDDEVRQYVWEFVDGRV